MKYYDTGVLIKLYTLAAESERVRDMVVQDGRPILFHPLHHSECISALHLKCFREECTLSQSSRAVADIEDDMQQGVLDTKEPDWNACWELCCELSQAHAAVTGCRTLDALHIACAKVLGIREFVSCDRGQLLTPERAGLKVVHPFDG